MSRPIYQPHLDRAHRDRSLKDLDFHMLYEYVHDGHVSAADDMAARLGVGKNSAKAAQSRLEAQGYITKTRACAAGIHYTVLGFTTLPGEEWGSFVDIQSLLEDPEDVVAEAETILLGASATNYDEDVTDSPAVTNYQKRDDKGRFTKALVTPTDPWGSVLDSYAAVQLTALAKYSYPTDTHIKPRQRGVDYVPTPTDAEEPLVIRSLPSSDFESPTGSDFGDDFLGGLPELDEDEVPAKPVTRRGRGEVFVLRSRAYDNRAEKDPSTWNGRDLAAEFGSLVRQKCPDLVHSNNFARVAGALGHLVKTGFDAAELKQIMVLFFADPRNLRAGSVPIWKRFLASLPGYQDPARRNCQDLWMG